MLILQSYVKKRWKKWNFTSRICYRRSLFYFYRAKSSFYSLCLFNDACLIVAVVVLVVTYYNLAQGHFSKNNEFDSTTSSASLHESSFNFLKWFHGRLNPFPLSIIQELGIRSSTPCALLWVSKEFSDDPFCAIDTSLSKAPFDAGELDLKPLSLGFFAGDIEVEDFDACLWTHYISNR